MKRNVKLSSYSIVLSGLSFVVFGMLLVNALRRDAPLWMIWSLGIAIFILCFAALCYTPLSVSVDGMNLCIQRPLKNQTHSLGRYCRCQTLSAHYGRTAYCGQRRMVWLLRLVFRARPRPLFCILWQGVRLFPRHPPRRA